MPIVATLNRVMRYPVSNDKPTRKHAKVYPDFEKTEVETFLSPQTIIKDLNLSHLPNVHNGILNFRKYSVTIELVEESHEVLIERLQYLWDKCGTMGNAETLRVAAVALAYKLIGEWGSDHRR